MLCFPPNEQPLQANIVEEVRECRPVGDGEECIFWEENGIISNWQEDSLAKAGPDDQVFEVNREEGYIEFGNDVNGKIPPHTGMEDRAYTVMITEYSTGPHDGFVDFAETMKEVDPTIRVGSAFGHADENDNPEPPVSLPEETLSLIDFFVMHPYTLPLNPDNESFDDFRNRVMAWSYLAPKVYIDAFRNQLGNEVDFAWTEWNLTYYDFTGPAPPNPNYTTSLDVGLYVADMLREAVADRLLATNYFVLAGWPRPQAERNQGIGLFTKYASTWPPEALVSTIAQPGALVFKMFGDYFGPEALPTTVTNSPHFPACWRDCPDSTTFPVVEALASRHPDGSLTVLLINKDDSLDVDVSIEFESDTLHDGNATWAILNSADPSLHPGTVTNTLEYPDAVSITTRDLPPAEPLLLAIPAHTVNMVVLPSGTPTSISDTPNDLPEKFELHQNYPNPFNPLTTIEYQLPVSDQVTLRILNVLGEEVRMLVNHNKSAGNYSVIWDGKNKLGRELASGIYLQIGKRG